MKDARLIVADSEHSADMLYATRFFAPDAFFYLEADGKKQVVLNQLEIDRGRSQIRGAEILPYEEIAKRAGNNPLFSDVLLHFLRENDITSVEVPSAFPFGLGSKLLAGGIEVRAKEGLFFPEREFKTAEELKRMRRALEITETGMARGIEVLKASTIGTDDTLYWEGEILTSERLRAEIDSAILRVGGLPANTIVAGGEQACDPHERGSGPLKAHSLIILDIFPRDAQTGYYGDMTRTVVRGKATPAQRQLWNTVLRGQEMALTAMKPGVDGGKLHEAITDFFTSEGYPTEQKEGRWSGFFHGTGHGLGLEIHEIPRFGKTTFQPGQVITVEPGLYYPGLGGVRIEDVVTITPDGVALLSHFDKQLEI